MMQMGQQPGGVPPNVGP